MTKQGVFTVGLVLTVVFAFFCGADSALADTSDVGGKTLYTYGETRDLTKVEILISSLGSADRHVRRISARALGKIGDHRAIKPLIKVLSSSDEDPAVRAMAAWALGALNAGQAMATLTDCLDSDDRQLQMLARSSLRRIATHYIKFAEAEQADIGRN